MSRLVCIGEERFRYEKTIAATMRPDIISPQPFARELELPGKIPVGLEKKE